MQEIVPQMMIYIDNNTVVSVVMVAFTAKVVQS